MKNLLIKSAGISAMLALSFAQPALATPITITDTYWGGFDHGYGDVIGHDSLFDITSMVVDRRDNILSVSINTNFAGRSGIFGRLTNNAVSQGRGIAYGDLFLSDSWTPNTDAPHYKNDNYVTGTAWSYAFSLDDRWSNTGGSGTLYSLTGDDSDTLISDDFISRSTYRNGQEVAVDASQKNADETFSTGRWGVIADTDSTVGKINFLIDLTGTSLEDSDTIALHWGMTCGNDTIEGEYTVPEPTILGLLAIGLIGVGFSKRNKAA